MVKRRTVNAKIVRSNRTSAALKSGDTIKIGDREYEVVSAIKYDIPARSNRDAYSFSTYEIKNDVGEILTCTGMTLEFFGTEIWS